MLWKMFFLEVMKKSVLLQKIEVTVILMQKAVMAHIHEEDLIIVHVVAVQVSQKMMIDVLM